MRIPGDKVGTYPTEFFVGTCDVCGKVSLCLDLYGSSMVYIKRGFICAACTLTLFDKAQDELLLRLHDAQRVINRD